MNAFHRACLSWLHVSQLSHANIGVVNCLLQVPPHPSNKRSSKSHPSLNVSHSWKWLLVLAYSPLHFLQPVNAVFGRSESQDVGVLFPSGAPRAYGLRHFQNSVAGAVVLTAPLWASQPAALGLLLLPPLSATPHLSLPCSWSGTMQTCAVSCPSWRSACEPPPSA